jgi:uncharacterized protein
MDMKDLKPGMELDGTVRNVIDFGAFVDIGVHQDGLVHLSEITDRYIKHPSDVLTVGDRVKVRVLSVDIEKKRISLTMKSGAPKEKLVPKDRKELSNKPVPMKKKEEPKDLDTMLNLLKNKFSGH